MKLRFDKVENVYPRNDKVNVVVHGTAKLLGHQTTLEKADCEVLLKYAATIVTGNGDDILSYGSSVRTDLENLGFRYDSSGPCVFRLRHHLPPRDLIGLAKEVSEIIEKVVTAVPGLQK